MKLDENRRERLELLADNLSLDIENNSELSVLLDVVDEALAEAFSYFEAVLADIFVLSAENDGAGLYLELLSRSFIGISPEEIMDIIVTSLSKQYGFYPYNTFFDKLDELCEGYQVNINEISNYEVEDFASVISTSKVFGNYSSPVKPYLIDGTGCTFDEWDDFDGTWYQLDDMDMPFRFLNTITIRR